MKMFRFVMTRQPHATCFRMDCSPVSYRPSVGKVGYGPSRGFGSAEWLRGLGFAFARVAMSGCLTIRPWRGRNPRSVGWSSTSGNLQLQSSQQGGLNSATGCLDQFERWAMPSEGSSSAEQAAEFSLQRTSSGERMAEFFPPTDEFGGVGGGFARSTNRVLSPATPRQPHRGL